MKEKGVSVMSRKISEGGFAEEVGMKEKEMTDRESCMGREGKGSRVVDYIL